MLLLFGRFKDPARLGLGVVMVIVGIVIHELILTLVGAAFIVWGLYTVVGTLRNRGYSRDRNRRPDSDSGDSGQGGDFGQGGDGGEGRPR
jgi:hypothetical protein